MTTLNTVVLGQNFTASVDFYNADGTPFVPNGPASYIIKDFNNNQVTMGYGAQDSMYPQRWTASLTLPDNAIYDPAKKYAIIWSITGGASGNSINSYTELFNVEPQYSVPSTEYVESVVVYGNAISDSLVLDPKDVATSLTLRLLDEHNIVYDTTTVDPSTISNKNGNNVYLASFTNTSLCTSFRPYIIEWTFVVNGVTRREYHFVYVISVKMIIMMENLRNFIDKIRFNHPNPNLRYSEADLMYYITQGITIVNGSKPHVTNVNINNFPMELDWYLTNAAAYVALSAQYMAEGVSAFEFSGQSVSLTIDRTQYLDNALSRIIDVIDNKLPIVKANLIKASSPGVLYISWSPSLNLNRAFSASFANDGFPGDFIVRSFTYDNIINQLNMIVE